MSNITYAIGAPKPGAPLETMAIERRGLGPDDVAIDIAYVGLCHSDIHTVRGEWGDAQFPMVPGHEITGVVAAIGPEVTRHQVGDRVAVGYMVDSCGVCRHCLAGTEQFCLRGHVTTYNGLGYDGRPTHGGYSRRIVVRDRFVCRVPDGLALDVAAPLLCAGITTYAPLRRWGVEPGTRVAVVGLGGLGHMAVKLAVAMGADVSVLSRTTAKMADALWLGAHEFHATCAPSVFDGLRGRFELVLLTVPARLPLDPYLETLRVGGVLVLVGLPGEPLSFDPFSLVDNNAVVAGSLVGGIAETQQLLDFCAEHRVGAEIETISADQINAAYARVLDGEVRYRFVMDASTIGDERLT
ncbi:NAD(P)-dependent alcohol dehydrogenase [Streptomyces sp. PTM05]|uniref:alcohol dehydrogenase (NADP(+)) n=1 Tax=Streptantibioticus parmotrematis TaxID=2873249 RepID=A0ABS7QZ05_9ACTN|nr:NAD(P)-dependent alcohol dehydrogenase [Streptantibioticus parmotrematis]MBY8887012.1 NAD(P)-dependent alcohol dehydrogenase [Streptantibioticus parmotrematis]